MALSTEAIETIKNILKVFKPDWEFLELVSQPATRGLDSEKVIVFNGKKLDSNELSRISEQQNLSEYFKRVISEYKNRSISTDSSLTDVIMVKISRKKGGEEVIKIVGISLNLGKIVLEQT